MESSTATTLRARYLSVRFEDSCVLIPPPDLPKSGLRPRLVRKSYSLPLWKTTPPKKAAQGPPSHTDSPEPQAATGDKVDKKSFSLTVSVPSLTIKSKPRRPSLPPSPCLAKRSPELPLAPQGHTPSPPPLLRVPSFPRVQPASLTEAATVPLRPCCEACHPCVDAAVAKGEHWNVKWSSGAKRRYSEGEHAQLHSRPIFGVTRVWAPTGADMPLAAALQVDEVEVRRRTIDDGGALVRCIDEDALADSDEEGPTLSTVLPMPAHEEEDENMLFPLPSPRRTPNTSPYATPQSGSQVSLTMPTRVETTVSAPASPSPAFTSPVSASGSEPFVSGSSNDRSPLSPLSSPIELSEPQIPRGPPRFASQAAQRPRRPSFSSASGSLLRGSAAVLKGVAVGMTGTVSGVVR